MNISHPVVVKLAAYQVDINKNLSLVDTYTLVLTKSRRLRLDAVCPVTRHRPIAYAMALLGLYRLCIHGYKRPARDYTVNAEGKLLITSR